MFSINCIFPLLKWFANIATAFIIFTGNILYEWMTQYIHISNLIQREEVEVAGAQEKRINSLTSVCR